MNVACSRYSLIDEGGSVQVSVVMPADMFAALKVAGFQRRSLGEDGSAVSELVREAVRQWLEREINDPIVISAVR